jgi:hypothetical protein
MLLAAVGHTAVHVADWGDVVLVVVAAVIDVDDEEDGVEALLLQATAPIDSTPSAAAIERGRFLMVPTVFPDTEVRQGRRSRENHGRRATPHRPAAEGHERRGGGLHTVTLRNPP